MNSLIDAVRYEKTIFFPLVKEKLVFCYNWLCKRTIKQKNVKRAEINNFLDFIKIIKLLQMSINYFTFN